MKLLRLSYFVSFVVLIAFLTCGIAQEKERCIDETKYYWVSFGDKIKNNNRKLSELFKKGEVKAMAELWQKSENAVVAVLVTPEGKPLRTPEEIAKFWESLRERGVNDITFRTVNVFVTPVSAKTREGYDYLFYEVGQYSYTYSQGGEEAADPTGSYILCRRHTHGCRFR